MQRALSEFAANEDDGDNDGASILETDAVALGWQPWLDKIKDSVREHINPPAALGSGCRGLSDKCSAEAYKMHLQMPRCDRLGDHCATYISHTSDLGVEIGIPDFSINGDPASLLKHWIDRDTVPADMDVHASDPHDGFEGPETADCDSAASQGPEDLSEGDASFMPNALPISNSLRQCPPA